MEDVEVGRPVSYCRRQAPPGDTGDLQNAVKNQGKCQSAAYFLCLYCNANSHGHNVFYTFQASSLMSREKLEEVMKGLVDTKEHDQLKAMLKHNGLPMSGNKTEFGEGCGKHGAGRAAYVRAKTILNFFLRCPKRNRKLVYLQLDVFLHASVRWRFPLQAFLKLQITIQILFIFCSCGRATRGGWVSRSTGKVMCPGYFDEELKRRVRCKGPADPDSVVRAPWKELFG